MFSRFWNLLLLFYGVISSESSSILVPGERGGNVTLPCELKDLDIFDVILNRQSKIIPVCKTENCSGRAFQIGACDIVIKDLIFRDAGKYIMRVFYGNNQTEPKQREYHLQIHDEISVKIGEEPKLDVLLSNADKVETNSSGEWKEVWNRMDGVLNHHLTDSDGNLTIKGFKANDTGTYRVLDSKGEILITVTVKEYSTESKGELDGDKTYDSKYIVLSIVLPVVFVALIIFVFIMTCQHRQRNPEHDPQQRVPLQDRNPEHDPELRVPLQDRNPEHDPEQRVPLQDRNPEHDPELRVPLQDRNPEHDPELRVPLQDRNPEHDPELRVPLQDRNPEHDPEQRVPLRSIIPEAQNIQQH